MVQIVQQGFTLVPRFQVAPTTEFPQNQICASEACSLELLHETLLLHCGEWLPDSGFTNVLAHEHTLEVAACVRN